MLLVILCSWYAISTLSYHPHYIPYFNELIGDRKNAYKYLSDSNLDWEDKTFFLNQFKKAHLGIEFQDEAAGKNPKPGFFLIPAIYYTGVFNEEQFAWLREFEPLMHVAYSHYLFYVGPEELGQALARHPV